jgi:hypothetical protein
MKKLILLLPSILLFLLSHAQNYESDSVYHTPITKHAEAVKEVKDSIKSTIGYFVAVSSGSLIGCKTCNGGKQITASTSVLQGITLRDRLRVGMGVGLDSYLALQTLPVYGSVSWDVIGNKKRNAMVAQFSYGWAKPMPGKTDQEYGYTKSAGGRMVNPQIGYRVRYGDLMISLMVGQKYQRIETYFEYPSYQYLFNGKMIAGEPSRKKVRESYSRLAITLTVGWR